jgi:hypothetical protein
VADQADAGVFEAATDRLAQVLIGQPQVRIDERKYGPDTGARIVASLDAGQALTHFYGHGAIQQWSGGNIFNPARIAELTNTGRETFLTSATCYTGAFDWPLGDGIVTAMVLRPTGGAIGAWGASGGVQPIGQEQLAQVFYRAVLQGQTVGEAHRTALQSVADPELVWQFNLIGDPALHIDLSAAAPAVSAVSRLTLSGVTTGTR